ncbi:MAG: low-specificity L-threonine aldolase [Euryarchaeota archaeon]|nr:low-specificity L-threonine aldolase [Euryarchaeota archaeon]
MRTVDLRSDTVTYPSQEMMDAIADAELGDDVYKEDPTVNKLEEMAAKKMGKEAALLVASGTQGNLASVLTHTSKGDEVILGSESHIYWYEVGGIAALANLLVRPIKGNKGILDPEMIAKAVRPKNIHMAPTTLVCIENTHNREGGTVWTPEQIKKVRDVAEENELKLHMDGARIFNAAVAQGTKSAKMTKYVDSVMFCLSKGLACPIGSIICGTEEFIENARKNRKILGGGMRQAGIIAAPGIVALKSMVKRLDEDHKNARLLAEGLKDLGLTIDLSRVQTNIVIFQVAESEKFLSNLNKRGIKASDFGNGKLRMVTHYGIKKEDIEYVLDTLQVTL